MNVSKNLDSKPPCIISHLERVLTILRVLENGWYTVEELQAFYPDLSKRTFYRDLEDIELFLGKVIQKNEEKFHIASEDVSYFRPLELTYIEALSLYLICQVGQEASTKIPYLEAATSAMQKLKCLFQGFFSESMEYNLNHTMLNMSQQISVAENRSIFLDIIFALEKRNGVLISYDSIYEQHVIKTLLYPYFLHFTRHSWYVVGRSSLHQEVRTFHLERILQLEILTDKSFVIPPGWSYEKYRGNAWNMIRGDKDIDVVMRFSKKVARNVASVRWHKTQSMEFHADGTLTLNARVSGTKEIFWWILGYASEIEVLEPKTLRDEVHEEIRRMLKKYE